MTLGEPADLSEEQGASGMALQQLDQHLSDMAFVPHQKDPTAMDRVSQNADAPGIGMQKNHLTDQTREQMEKVSHRQAAQHHAKKEIKSDHETVQHNDLTEMLSNSHAD